MKFLAVCQLMVKALLAMLVRSRIPGTGSALVPVVVTVPAEQLPPIERAVMRR